eukprot:211792-Amphidinium_carterae.1
MAPTIGSAEQDYEVQLLSDEDDMPVVRHRLPRQDAGVQRWLRLQTPKRIAVCYPSTTLNLDTTLGWWCRAVRTNTSLASDVLLPVHCEVQTRPTSEVANMGHSWPGAELCCNVGSPTWDVSTDTFLTVVLDTLTLHVTWPTSADLTPHQKGSHLCPLSLQSATGASYVADRLGC